MSPVKSSIDPFTPLPLKPSSFAAFSNPKALVPSLSVPAISLI